MAAPVPEMRTAQMPVALPPASLTLARHGHPLAHALAITVLAIPVVIATLALTPRSSSARSCPPGTSAW